MGDDFNLVFPVQLLVDQIPVSEYELRCGRGAIIPSMMIENTSLWGLIPNVQSDGPRWKRRLNPLSMRYKGKDP
ncbi:MAG: hypothetical protein ABEL51_08060 [Salinibacter sp.]